MTEMHLYCKANKRKRNGQAVGVYAYIFQEGVEYKESIEILEGEIKVAKLEILALIKGLRDLEAMNKLEGNETLYIHVTNEYILEELQKGMEQQAQDKSIYLNKGTEYPELWEQVERLLNKNIKYIAAGLGKAERGEDDEVIKQNMGKLNKMACDEINRYFRAKE